MSSAANADQAQACDPDLEAIRRPLHLVTGGVEVVQLSEEGDSPAGRGGRFDNGLMRAPLLRIKRVLDVAVNLRDPTATRDILVAADATADPKGGLSALRVLDLEELAYATSGGRRQLIWNRGPRPDTVEPPRLVDRYRYGLLRDLLIARKGWLSTDYLIVEACFDPDLNADLSIQPSSADRDLPKSFFWDYGGSARRYVLGALKAFYWLEQVAWRCYSRQAVEWKWVGSGRKLTVAGAGDGLAVCGEEIDPYLLPDGVDPGPSRAERMAEAAEARVSARRREFEAWLEHHGPELAADRRARSREAERAQERLERDARREQEGRGYPSLPLVSSRPRRTTRPS